MKRVQVNKRNLEIANFIKGTMRERALSMETTTIRNWLVLDINDVLEVALRELAVELEIELPEELDR